MIVLIAESKTMTGCDRTLATEEYIRHRPQGEERADRIMDDIASMNIEELAHQSRLSPSLALRLWNMSKEFPYKATGQAAIEAYTGVVFKAIDRATLGPDDRNELCRRVRIISSLYGLLRPDDTIKAYRMDYTSPLAPDGRAMWAYWREAVTESIIEEIRAGGSRDVLDLLPGDAAKCVDMKAVGKHANVWKADFKELKDGGDFMTPRSGRLKTLRGHLVREIIERRINAPEELMRLNTPMLQAMGTPDFPDHIAFCV